MCSYKDKVLVLKDCLDNDLIIILNKGVFKELEFLLLIIKGFWYVNFWKLYDVFIKIFGLYVIMFVICGLMIK